MQREAGLPPPVPVRGVPAAGTTTEPLDLRCSTLVVRTDDGAQSPMGLILACTAR